MNAPSPDFSRPAGAQDAPHGPLAERWSALYDAGAAVAALAGIAPEEASAAVRSFPRRIDAASAQRRELAEQGIADLAAMMQPGLAALLAVRARGQDAAAPAATLWHEFLAARDALLRLAPPTGVTEQTDEA